MMKRTLCAALALTLTAVLAGCGGDTPGGSGGAAPMGRYIETHLGTLTGVGRVYGGRLDSGGNMTAYLTSAEGPQVRRVTVPAGGGAPVEETADWLTAIAESGGHLVDVGTGAGGEVYAIYSRLEENTERYHLVRTADGSETEEISISDWERPDEDGAASDYAPPLDGAPSISIGAPSGSVSFGSQREGSSRAPSGLLPLEGGGFLILYGIEGAARYGEDGALLLEFPGVAFRNNTAADGNRLLMMDSEMSGFLSCDLDTGEGSPLSFEGVDYGTLPCLDKEGVYLINNTGLYSQANGGSVWEQLVDGELTSLVMPNLIPMAAASEGNGSFVVFLMGDGECEVVRYSYSADTPTNPDTELTIAGLHDNPTIRQAIGEFQRRSSSVRVNYRVLMEDGSSATAEDVIRALNAQLLTGQGPDLLLLDGLPVDSYIEKGVLADLDGQLEDRSRELLTNLMGAYRRADGLYGVPTHFTLPIMLGKAEDVALMNSLEDLEAQVRARQGGEIPFLLAGMELWSREGIAPKYVQASAAQWQREDGSIDEAARADFFRALSGLDRTLKEHTPQSDDSVILSVVTGTVGTGAEILDMGADELARGMAQFHVQELAGVYNLNTICSKLDAAEGWAMDSLFGAGGYYPWGAVGIVAATEKRELADAFLDLLLSPTVQDVYMGGSFPVNRQSLEKNLSAVLEGGGDMGFLDLCQRVGVPLVTDETPRDTVLSEAAALLAGEVTPEQAAANVVERTSLYLAE